MKYLLLPVLYFLFSCQNRAPEQTASYKKTSLVDSNLIKNSNTTEADKKPLNSEGETASSKIYWDTVGVANGPIKILKAYFTRREYSTYKDIALNYKNVSGRTITAIRFSWYGLTAFNDPADMGTSVREGFGGGFTDQTIKPGSTRTSEWSILSRNGKTVVKAWPTEVVFDDGTKWESSYR